ncbi:MAG TPA: DUF4388 domain-containing protein [Vicinamibacteria bacterium]|jgi:hypothetical protein|nr:DUF4388 domain-containing protein [Vicinamibacteria bacterium]
MAFQGSLAELHLPDIIQLISVSGKTGVFHLTDGALKGEIYLNEGKIVHAQNEDTSGEEAVYALAIWRQGEFRFDPGPATELKTITKSNTNLLMEAARRLDEWRVLSKKIPSTDLIPEFVVQENREGQINLNTSEWLILSKIDGQRTVKAIAAASGLSVFDAAKMLYGLIATGLIRLREAAPVAAPRPAAVRPGTPAAPPPAPSHPAGTGTPARGTPAPDPHVADLIAKLGRVKDECSALLGSVGETVVNKHYQKARAEIERGAGIEVIEEAVHQIARAASILKGPSAAESLLEQLKGLK